MMMLSNPTFKRLAPLLSLLLSFFALFAVAVLFQRGIVQSITANQNDISRINQFLCAADPGPWRERGVILDGLVQTLVPVAKQRLALAKSSAERLVYTKGYQDLVRYHGVLQRELTAGAGDSCP